MSSQSSARTTAIRIRSGQESAAWASRSSWLVDHYVPTYDKDAGSKTTYQYLKMFLKKGYVVKFLGDNFMNEEPYTSELEQMGIEVLYGPEYQVKIWDWLRDHGDDIAVAYLNRPHIASKYIDYILDNTDIKVIYYGHDLHWLRESREYQITKDPKIREVRNTGSPLSLH